ncbi:MAG: hypothetical protein K2X82_24675 [Gemmataceae bacterium]|nr:hypothetical protein [Gemmataceae bacterium]
MRVLIAVVLGGAAVAALVVRSAPVADEPEWEFRPDYEMRVPYWWPGEGLVYGHFGVTGVFVPDPLSEGDGPRLVLDLPWAVNFPQGDPDKPRSEQPPEAVYEFRLGVLVPGTLHHPGVFVPTVGGRAIGVDDYRPERGGKKAPRIYNLPGTIEPVPAGRKRRPFRPPPLSPVDGWAGDWATDGLIRREPAPPPRRALVADPGRWVGVLRGGRVAVGKLDAGGVFTPDPGVEPVADAGGTTATARLPDGTAAEVPVINRPSGPGQEMVFELQRGALVRGTLKADGRFVPWPWSRVLWWSWYERAEDPEYRIYNLPGRIVDVAPPPRKR